MKSGNIPPAPAPAPLGGFRFFPPRDLDVEAEGRDPHAQIKTDPLAAQFPTERQIAMILGLFSFLLYLFSMSWTAFPGLPTRALLVHLRMEVTPSALNLVWGWGVKLADRLPWLPVAAWMGLFSAACGSLAVALMGRLMIRVGYLIRNEPGLESFRREAQARRLSGLVAGLYLACCIPFWVVSTRSLPGSFHVLLLLLTAWNYSQYQHWGKLRHLAMLGLLYGVGITESATFIVYLPLAVFLVAREMFRWRALRAWRPQLVVWSSLLLGLSLYAYHAHKLYGHAAHLQLLTDRWEAWAWMLREQFDVIARVRFSPGFPVIMFFTLVPWLTLFAMSRRSPWFYEIGQVIVRLIFVGGLLGVLFNAAFAPWNLLGMSYLMVTPYLLLAVGMGYMTGEFWILGEHQPLVDIFRSVYFGRQFSSVFALALPLVILGAGVANWQTVDGRHGVVLDEACGKILERLDGRDVLFTTGVFDDALRLKVREQRVPVRLVSASRISSPVFLRLLGRTFAEEELRVPLAQGDFALFLDNLLLSDAGVARTAIIDLPDVFREFGYLIPDGFLYRLETSSDRLNLPALVASQRDFWNSMEAMAGRLAPEVNLARPYQDMLRLLASKVANNLGVLQMENGDEAGALDTFRSGRRIYPENLSVLMNLLELARTRDLPEEAELEADWEAIQDRLEGVRWSLAIRFGYVWNAAEWVRRGWVWALSGSPVSEQAARRKPPPVEDDTGGRAGMLDQAYLQWGQPPRDENHFRAMLIKDEKDTVALTALCRLALRRNDPEAAEAYLAEAMRMGLSEAAVLFDRAMVAYVRGDRAAAVTHLDDLSRAQPGDPRIWMALALLTGPEDPLNRQAVRTLKLHRAAGLSVRLVLASLHMARQEWKEAQAELEKAVQIDSRNKQVWEMMVTVAQETGSRRLMESSLRALFQRDPEHYLQYQNQGVAHYQRGNLEEAEQAFRKGVQRRRDATLLNNLAHVITKRRGDLREALELVNEAMRRQPGLGPLFTTRGEIYMALGRHAEARDDLQASLQKNGRDDDVLFKLAQTYERLGERERAGKVAGVLAARRAELSPLQQMELDALLARLR
jgi:tetratricopeptide (TPR) repeat protein